jgi:flavin-binding protein dodecin
MSVAKVIELSATSERSFEDAIQQGVARASQSLHGIRSAWIKEQRCNIENGRITGYQVNIQVTFVLDDGEDDNDRGGSRRGGGSGGRGKRR